MKAKHFVLAALFLCAGCSLIWSPTDTVKKFISSAEKGDVDTMTGLFSSDAIKKLGSERIRSNNQNFADMARKAIAGGAKPQMNELKELVTGNTAHVSFVYQDKEKNSSIGMVFDLSKEGGAWKIDNLGDSELENRTSVETPTPNEPALVQELAPPPPPLSEKSETETKSPTSGKTISGGVLNGKAISLPKPEYPPIAKAAKASGTVVVQVIVDENGNVIAAHAVSGHPLLQAAAIAAARSAKFSPTKLSGQPVRVTGVITYQFVAE